MSIRKIAVVGATGMLGRPITRELIDAGFDVTIVARSPHKAEHLFPGVPVREADVLDAGATRRALEGQEAVYVSLSTPPSEGRNGPHAELDGTHNIAAAASRQGLKRIGYLSSLVMNYQGQDGFYWWAFDVKQKGVEIVKESDVPHVLFYPSTFMENFEHDQRQGHRLLVAGTSRHPMYFIAGRDYGRQVVHAFQRLTDDVSREYVVQGPEAYTAEEAACIYAKNYTAQDLKVTKVPMWLVKMLGLVSPRMRYTSRIVEAINNYPEPFRAETTWEELGAPTTRLADYARQASKGAAG